MYTVSAMDEFHVFAVLSMAAALPAYSAISGHNQFLSRLVGSIRHS
ncbi:MAG: hypothetical protein GY938_04890 [Ketobacter sp.]|nr:hypothetical protein [Ketobacter sp.]